MIYKIAILCTEALRKEFPQYQYSLTSRNGLLTESMIGDWFILLFPKSESLMIFMLIFSPTYIKIITRYDDYMTYYTDPQFTENILSDILKMYERSSDKNTWHSNVITEHV